ncbi:MAG: hypothetical protein IT200_06100 [Thermoleophilia bacterium]|nr:hypothetical protein [Thermoleophilia bacterium]
MSSIRDSRIWKRIAAIGVAVGLSAGAIGVGAATSGGSGSSASGQQAGVAQAPAGGYGAQGTPAQGTAPDATGGMQGPPGGGGGPDLAAAATALGTTESAVRQAMSDGTSIAAQATSAGVDVDTVIAAMVTSETAALQAQVTSGTLTQDQADQMIAGLTERVTALVNGEMSGPPQDGQGTPPAMPSQGTGSQGTGDAVQG